MSILGTYAGNLQQPINVNLGSTTPTDIIVAEEDSNVVSSFAFANTTAGAVTCTLEWYSAKTAQYYVIWIGSVAAVTTNVQSDVPISLRDGDKIRATGASGVRITLFNMFKFALNRP